MSYLIELTMITTGNVCECFDSDKVPKKQIATTVYIFLKKEVKLLSLIQQILF